MPVFVKSHIRKGKAVEAHYRKSTPRQVRLHALRDRMDKRMQVLEKRYDNKRRGISGPHTPFTFRVQNKRAIKIMDAIRKSQGKWHYGR